ncbi:transglycosylase domain-containing protein [Goekera deserti]|nr:transglycosylase domain-containing protein [Goekera deserti]
MRRFKFLLGGVAGLFVLFAVFIGVVYATTEVPSLSSLQTNQSSIIYYSDGTTEMDRLGTENRTNVTIDQISEPAKYAVLAAENRSFYTDPGISFTGIVRAAWNNVTGGSTQGGSTITQQYVGLSFLDNTTSYSGKFKEIFLAVKLDNTVSKDEILQNYLNTIYYGRGAYGIEAAANTYFGVPASQLTAEQGAVLAVLIRNPTFYDPESNPEGAQDRWGLVLDGMQGEGWLTAEQRAAAVYPQVMPRVTSTLGTLPEGPEGLIVTQVQDELADVYGYERDEQQTGGLRITTTIDKPKQDAAVAAVADVMEADASNGGDTELRQALVAVDPRTGGVLAYYGGSLGTGTDYAQAQRAPGSSMKPYTLAAALEEGISVNARRDGSSPQTFPDRTQPVRNSGNAQCASCTLVQAITRSLNTTFYGLAYEVTPEKVRDVALAATGMPDIWPSGYLNGQRTLSVPTDPSLPPSPQTQSAGAAIGIGEYAMRPIDQAAGFATFANGGLRHATHFVARVTDTTGAVRVDNTTGDEGTQAVPADVANDVTFALEGVASYSKRALDGARPVASKTGTQGLNAQDNSDAWMVGYTPSISTAVWMGKDNTNDPIVNANGGIIFGSGLPGAIWQEFMDTVLDGTPEEPLPTKALIRGDTGRGVPEATTAPQTTQPRATTQAPAPTTDAPAPTAESEPTATATTEAPPPTVATPTTTVPPPAQPSVPVAPGVPPTQPGTPPGQGLPAPPTQPDR